MHLLRVQSGNIDSQGFRCIHVYLEYTLGAVLIADGHLRRVGALRQDLGGHLSCLIAQSLVINAVSSQAAVGNHAGLAYNGGKAVLVGYHGHSSHSAGDHVVGGRVEHIYLSYRGGNHCLDLVGTGNSQPLCG